MSLDRNAQPAEAEQTLQLIRSAGSDGAVFCAELTDNSAVEKMCQAIAKRFGGLDILINSASVFSPGTADKTTPELWDSQMDSNAKAPFFVAQHAARLMLARGHGKIVSERYYHGTDAEDRLPIFSVTKSVPKP